MIFRFANFAESTLSLALSQDATSVFIPPSDAGLFPALGVGEVCAVTLEDGYQSPEIVYVTSNPGTGTLGIERAKEGTSAKAWPAGSLFVHTLTRESILWFSSGGATDLIADLQAQIDALVAADAAQDAAIAALQSYVDEKVLDLTASIEQSNASISVLSQVVADNNFAMTQITTTLTANVSSNTAQISTIFSTIATNQSAQATINSNLTASINGVQSNLNSYQTAQATQNAAFTSSITTLTASYGNQQAQVTTNTTAIATINGSLSGKYLVAISAGQFASFELAAGSGTSSYSYAAFNVSKFYINDPTGTYNPFRFDTGTGTAYLQNAYIQNAWVENLTLTKGKIGYNEITDRASFVAAPSLVLTAVDQQVVAGYYGSAGGDLEIDTQLTVLAGAPGDSYISVSVYVNGGLLKSWPWYFKTGAYDTKFVQAATSPGSGLFYMEIRAKLETGSSSATVSIAELKVKEFNR